MSPPRFVHRRITPEQFKAELDHHNISLAGFTRIWCQNLTRVSRWSTGQEDIPTWVPIALTAMRMEGAMRTLRDGAAAMIEFDRMHPELGQFPYKKLRDMPEDETG